MACEEGDYTYEGQKAALECSDTIQIKVGEKLFEIPRNSGSIIIDFSKNLPCDGYIETDNFIYRPYKFMGHDDFEERQFIVSISIYYDDNKGKYEINDTFKKSNLFQKLEKQNLSLENLPVDDNFYKFENGPKQYLFVTADKNFMTPLDNPITFGCMELFSDPQNYTCGTTETWNNSYRIGIGSFTTKTFPISQWKELHAYFLKYIDNLEITSLEKEE